MYILQLTFSQPWVANSRQEISPQPLEHSVLHSLRQYALASHMKRAALTMMAYSLTTKDIEGNNMIMMACILF